MLRLFAVLPAPVALAALLVLAGCGGVSLPILEPAGPVTTPESVDHGAFDAALKAHVDARGMVDYAALRRDRVLRPYLERLASIDPAQLPEDEALAFWINVYNANTLQLVVANYPVGSITELVPAAPFGLRVFIPKVNSPFEQRFIRVGGRELLSLDDVEHRIIRARFGDPRIHFALVCAAVSCPPLRREAYTGARLDAQLDDQARAFLHDPTKNAIPDGPGTARLSKILDWYGSDFGDGPAELQRSLARYFEGDVQETLARGGYALSFFSYDWSLNDQAAAR